jgi:hypothetical protein
LHAEPQKRQPAGRLPELRTKTAQAYKTSPNHLNMAQDSRQAMLN